MGARFQNKGDVLSCLISRSLCIGSAHLSPQTVDIQGKTDIIDGQSGSAGEQPDGTKGSGVFSNGNRGRFAFSMPFVLKTHFNIRDPVD